MVKRQNRLDDVLGNVIRGKYTTFGMNLEDLSAASGIPYGTLRKKLAGTNPLHVVELIAIARAIGHGVTAHELMVEAERILAAMSPAAPTTDLTKKREQKEAEARSMTIDQLAETKHAATRDPELGTDEPEAP